MKLSFYKFIYFTKFVLYLHSHHEKIGIKPTKNKFEYLNEKKDSKLYSYNKYFSILKVAVMTKLCANTIDIF